MLLSILVMSVLTLAKYLPTVSLLIIASLEVFTFATNPLLLGP